MTATLLQTKQAQSSGLSLAVTLDEAPTVGATLIAFAASTALVNPATGWTAAPSTAGVQASAGGKLYAFYRVVDGTDTGTYTFTKSSSVTHITVMEWSGLGDLWDTGSATDQASTGTLTLSPVDPAGSEGLIVGAFVGDAPGTAGGNTQADLSFAAPYTEVWYSDATGITDPDTTSGTRPAYLVGYEVDPAGIVIVVTATKETGGFASGGWGGIVLVFPAGDAPPDPEIPPLPPYVDPEPADALLEIYVTDPDAAGGWGPTGSGAWGDPEWAASGWEDITPLAVTASITWGATRADDGILADIVGATWEIKLFDPDRILDPANEDSPYWPQIAPGLPVRISHRGVIFRTGILDTAAHGYADDTGVFRVTDAIAELVRARVPEDSVLADVLYERARDAIGAAGLSITSFAGGGPAVGTQIEGERSAWDHIRLAARDAGYVAFVNRYNELAFSPWGVPSDRSRTIAADELTELAVYIDDDGLYSRVRATEDGTTYIERAITPTPRYGVRVYQRSEPVADADAFATRILGDRFAASLRYGLGAIRPLTAARVEVLGTLTCNELVGLDVPGTITATTRILGGRFTVVWGRYDEAGEDRPRWTFWYVTTSTTAALLVDDDAGEPLVSDDDADIFLEAD